MMFGALIDSTCRLWQTDSSGCHGSDSRGSCLLFDNDQLRWRTYGVVLGFEVIQLVFFFLLYFTVRRRRFDRDDLTSDRTSCKSPPQPTHADDNTSPTFDALNLVETTEDQPTVTQVQTQ